MKKLVLIIAAVALGIPNIQAAKTETTIETNFVRGYGNSFIFVEDGVTFSVYPDGVRLLHGQQGECGHWSPDW